MPAVSESTVVPAPVEAVFAFLDEPENQAAVTPGIRTAERVERLPNGGNRARYVYTMAGVPFEGEVAATAYDPPERIVYEVSGGVEGRIEWTLDPVEGGTRFTYAADYELPVAALSRLAEPVVRRYNHRQVTKALANVREEFEGRSGE